MLDVIRKAEYFDWCDRKLVPNGHHQLKVTQDAWVLSMLGDTSGRRLAEAGGGTSRVLERLKAGNECWNIDKFEGVGQGPQGVPHVKGVKVVPAYLGDFDPRLPDEHFDAVFSISVVEHVPGDRLGPFMRDCARILKPGGLLLHAIDLYLFDRPSGLDRVDHYRTVHEREGLPLDWVEPPRVDRDLTFSCAFASNADYTMYRWNQIVPALRATRESAQSVSLKAAWRKRRGGPG